MIVRAASRKAPSAKANSPVAAWSSEASFKSPHGESTDHLRSRSHGPGGGSSVGQ